MSNWFTQTISQASNTLDSHGYIKTKLVLVKQTMLKQAVLLRALQALPLLRINFVLIRGLH